MRTICIVGAVLLLLGCTSIASFISGAMYEREYQERKNLDKIINCLKEDRSNGNKR